MVPIWVIGFIWFINNICKFIGFLRLNHYENINCGFIKSLGNTIFINGHTRSGKTTAVVDMALSVQVMFREKALNILKEISCRFPNFNFNYFEKVINSKIKKHEIFNLASCKDFIDKVCSSFVNNPLAKNLFYYDIEKYSLFFYDNLKNEFIFDALKDYACAYFIYSSSYSYIVGNLCVRNDIILKNEGYFPLYDNDFFDKDINSLIDGNHSHLLDYDSLRLFRKMVTNNKYSNALDFGVIVCSEVGKERGNMLDLKELKKNDGEVNQKNDGFTAFMKMHGHSSTIRNVCFSCFIMDDQRPESLGADARALSNLVEVLDNGDNNKKLALPFFYFRNLIITWLHNKLDKIYYQYRNLRNDNTLLFYLIHSFDSLIFNYQNNINNLYGFKIVSFGVCNGNNIESDRKSANYYLSFKKVYSTRFDTACFGSYFYNKQITSKYGLFDLPEYQNITPNVNELMASNSYFINDLYGKESKNS